MALKPAPSAPEVDHVAIMGLHFLADARDPNLTSKVVAVNPTGINILTHSDGILVENCQVEYYGVNLNFQDFKGPVANVTVRRNVITDAWSNNSHSQGMYASGVYNLTIQDNLFDHNGWNTQIAGAAPTWYNHDCYLSSKNTNCVITGNTFARAAGYGLQARSGGIVRNNSFIDDPVGMSYGLVNGASSTVGGVTGDVTANVFVGGADIGKLKMGIGLIIGNIKPGAGAVICGNIFTHAEVGGGAAIMLAAGRFQSNPRDSVGINDLVIKQNIVYSWTIGIDVEGGQVAGGKGLTAFNRVSLVANEFENLTGPAFENHDASLAAQEKFTGNSFYNAGSVATSPGEILLKPFAFAQPGRTIATYDATVGTNSGTADFLASAAQQSLQDWNPVYTGSAVSQYIIQGFVTSGAVSSRSAMGTFEALNYDYQSGGLKFDNFKGLGYADGGEWAEFAQIDFGTGVSQFTATVAALSKLAGSIELHLDSPTGSLIGTLHVTPTGAWSNYVAQSTAITGAKGVHNLYLVFVGGKGVANVESFKFD